MSDYNGNDIWNKYVLSSGLNESTDGALLMLTGSAFHAIDPATVKERSPNLERVRGMSSRWRDDDLRSAVVVVVVRFKLLLPLVTLCAGSQIGGIQ